MRELRSPIALLLAIAALVVAGCGESEQQKAQKKVCSARADISKQVDELKGMTLATASVDGVRENVDAIQKDLQDIANAQGTLSDDRKAAVKTATDQFKTQVTEIANGVKGSLSLSEAKTQLQTAAQDLATAYSNSLGKIDC
jgi:hypothetical protein